MPGPCPGTRGPASAPPAEAQIAEESRGKARSCLCRLPVSARSRRQRLRLHDPWVLVVGPGFPDRGGRRLHCLLFLLLPQQPAQQCLAAVLLNASVVVLTLCSPHPHLISVVADNAAA